MTTTKNKASTSKTQRRPISTSNFLPPLVVTLHKTVEVWSWSAPFFFFPLTVAESSTFRPPASKSAATIVLKPTTRRAMKRQGGGNSCRGKRGPRTNQAQLPRTAKKSYVCAMPLLLSVGKTSGPFGGPTTRNKLERKTHRPFKPTIGTE